MTELTDDVLLDRARGFVRQPSQAEDGVQATWLFRIVANRARTKAVEDARYGSPDPDDRFTSSGRLKAPSAGGTVNRQFGRARLVPLRTVLSHNAP